MAIRWGRGLFRLWLVGAVAWLIAMAIAWWNPVWSPSGYVENRAFGVLRETGEPVPLHTQELAAAAEGKKRGLLKEVTIGSVPEHPWLRDISVFVRSELADAQISEVVDKVSARLAGEYDQQVEASRGRNIGGAALSMFLPPLLLLAIGAALFWALRGFSGGEKPRR